MTLPNSRSCDPAEVTLTCPGDSGWSSMTLGDPGWSCMVLGDVRWTQMPLSALSGLGEGWLVRWP